MASTLLLASPGVALFVSPGGGLLTGSGGGGGGTSFTGPYPDAISGLLFWHDAGALSGYAGNSGWSKSCTGLIDKSGNGNGISTPWTAGGGYGGGYTGAIAFPRLNGSLGGVTVQQAAGDDFGTWSPWIDSGAKFAVSGSGQFGSNHDWTIYLVYSRPNTRQDYVNSNIDSGGGYIPLVTVGSNVVVGLGGKGDGTDHIVLFPAGSATSIASGLTRRHTHSVTLINKAGVGLDVYLDDTKVATAAANALASDLTAAVTFLGDSTGGNGAQCYLHEDAAYSQAVAGAELSKLLTGTTVTAPDSAGSCSKRWARGNRPGAIVLGIGQSGAEHWAGDGGRYAAQQTIRYYLGALAFQLLARPGGSIFSGTPIYSDSPGDTSAWLANPNPTNDPLSGAGWSTGVMGSALVSMLGGGFVTNAQAIVTAADLADVWGAYFHWSENDSISHGYSGKTTLKHAVTRMLNVIRSTVGKPAAQLPAMWLNALPYGGSFNQVPSAGDSTIQGFREAIADLAADSLVNLSVALPMTADAIGNGASDDASTGLWTGGDDAHLDDVDNLAFSRRIGLAAARSVVASGFSDPGGQTIPSSGVGAGTGPKVSHVQLVNSTTAIVTVTHDAGNDLIVPLQAANGVGWTMLDGGTVASPGSLKRATACARIDATHLQLTFPAISNAAASCQLFYPWGYAKIGRGNAVTDNYSAVTKAAGFDVAADLGGLWSFNFPIAASDYGFPVSASS